MYHDTRYTVFKNRLSTTQKKEGRANCQLTVTVEKWRRFRKGVKLDYVILKGEP